MSMPMNNINQGGYTPYGNPGGGAFGAGYPNPNDPIQQQPGYGGYHPDQGHNNAVAHQPGFQPQGGGYQLPPGYQPLPQQQPMSYPPPGPGAMMPVVQQPGAQQPGQNGWMNMPTGIPNCPPGLEYLTSIDQLLVKQKVELLEAFTGFETNNKYTIKNSLGQNVYWAVEETDCCTRNCCGPARPFDMKILDIYRNQVIHLNRPLACSACCFPCCLQSMEVSSPPGNVIGKIEQEWSICYPQFRLLNQTGETVLRIEGPLCTFSMCGDVEFKVVSLTGEQVGKISKQWSGFAREIFTDADFFGITFPMDLDVRMKAVLLGACFLIDMMFFEKSGNRETDTPGMF